MSHNPIILVVLATDKLETANGLLKSMQDNLPNFRISASILLIGAPYVSANCEFCVPVDIIDSITFYPPIVDSRNICQRHLQEKMEKERGIGFILDDDLLWTLPENKFIALINKLIGQECDMAFSALSGDSPIPKEYTRTSPLLDVLMAIREADSSDKVADINKYLGGINTSQLGHAECNAHHDFYSFNQKIFCRYDVNISTLQWDIFIAHLVTGKTTTRQVQVTSKITKASGRERGGATLIFDKDVLSFKNDAIRSDRLISRRSDMIMATDAANRNFKLFNTPPMLEHRRNKAFDTHDSNKLIGDILGYALIESRNDIKYCVNKFQINLSSRIKHTKLLLTESSIMLKLLDKWLSEHNHIELEQSNELNSMISENERTMSAIISIDLELTLESFREFAINRGH